MTSPPNAFRSLTAASVALFALTLAADAQVLHVDDDAPNDPGPGNPALSDPLEDGTAGRPYDRIQEAISAAGAGTEIQIAAGTYVDFATISLEGKEIWLHGVDGPDVTIVDATTLTDQVMQAILGETSATVVEGLTLRGGVARSGTPNDRGAGLYVNNSSVTIRNCILENNDAVYGGALYMNLATDVIVEGCEFLSNDAYRGGAIYANLSAFTLDDCRLDDNTTMDHGGAIFSGTTTVSASNSSFQNNACVNYGGAIYATSSPLTLEDCSFSLNGATYGGALMLWSSTTDVTRCSFDGNTSSYSGGAIYKTGAEALGVHRSRFTANDANPAAIYLAGGTVDRVQDSIFNGNLGTTTAAIGTSSGHTIEVFSCTFAWNQGTAVQGYPNVRVRSSILWGNTSEVSGAVSVEYSDVLGGYAGAGNIGVDPLFRNPLGPDGLAGTPDDDFHLTGASPCIDAGDTRILGDGSPPYPVDYFGKPRAVDRESTPDTGWALIGHTTDMGVHEFPSPCNPKLKQVKL